MGSGGITLTLLLLISYVNPYGWSTSESARKEPNFPRLTILLESDAAQEQPVNITHELASSLQLLISPVGSRTRTVSPARITLSSIIIDNGKFQGAVNAGRRAVGSCFIARAAFTRATTTCCLVPVKFKLHEGCGSLSGSN